MQYWYHLFDMFVINVCRILSVSEGIIIYQRVDILFSLEIRITLPLTICQRWYNK